MPEPVLYWPNNAGLLLVGFGTPRTNRYDTVRRSLNLNLTLLDLGHISRVSSRHLQLETSQWLADHPSSQKWHLALLRTYLAALLSIGEGSEIGKNYFLGTVHVGAGPMP